MCDMTPALAANDQPAGPRDLDLKRLLYPCHDATSQRLTREENTSTSPPTLVPPSGLTSSLQTSSRISIPGTSSVALEGQSTSSITNNSNHYASQNPLGTPEHSILQSWPHS